MNFKTALATAALAVGSALTANAATIGQTTLDQTNFVNYPGDTIYLTGNFTNISTTDTIQIDALSLQTNPSEIDNDDFSGYYSTDILGPGQDLVSVFGPNDSPTFSDVEFADITSNTQSYTGNIYVIFDDLTTGTTFQVSNEAVFGTSVPEPGSLSLLSGCLLGGGLLIKRRRK